MQPSLEVAFATAEGLRQDGALMAAGNAFQRLLIAYPEAGAAWRGWALVAEALGDVPAALERMQRAVALLPAGQCHMAHLDLARLHMAQQQPQQAVAMALEAVQGFLGEQRYDEAIGILRQIRQIDAQNEAARLLLRGWLHNLALQSLDTPEIALSYAEEADNVPGEDDPKLLATLARLYTNTDQAAARLSALDRMVALFDLRAPATASAQGLLDIELADATPEQIAGALLSDGAVLIRGLLDPAAQTHFLNLADVRWLSEPDQIIGPLSPVLVQAMAILLGRPPEPFLHSSNVRTASLADDQSYLYYHQDLTPLYTMGINLWAALDPIDGTRPGLEMLVRRQHRAFPVVAGHMIGVPPYRIPDEAVRGVFPDSDFVVPRMDVGDGMLFLFSTIHRSHWTGDMTQSRRNAELRFI